MNHFHNHSIKCLIEVNSYEDSELNIHILIHTTYSAYAIVTG